MRSLADFVQARVGTGGGDQRSLQLRLLDDGDAGESGREESGSDDLDALRALCVAAWMHADADSGPLGRADAAPVWRVEAADEVARDVVAALRLV